MLRFTALSLLSCGLLAMSGWVSAEAESVEDSQIESSQKESSNAKNPFKPTHIRAGLNYSFPRADENWDGGLGFQGQVLMPAAHFGEAYQYGISLGMSTWNANEDIQTVTSSNAESGALSGDVRAVQIGVSIIRTQPMSHGFNLNFETGLVYQSMSSDTQLTYTYSDDSQQTQGLEIDNALTGLLAVDVNTTVAEGVNVFAGLAYQFDIAKGDATALSDTNENVLNALMIRSGVELKF